jgi:pimeloyl-ACP methyl ester carboxylesterase
MKLAQRIVLVYYRKKLKWLSALSPRKAAEEAFKLFCTPYSKRKTYEAPPVFRQAKKLSFRFQHEHVHGFHWTPAHANGQKILICHGFDSHSYKFDKYIQPLLTKGFEVFAFDAPAHGLSSGKRINAGQYRDIILHINQEYGPMDGIMAHSLGGLAVALAMEKMSGNTQTRLVLIAPATESTRAINTFFTFLPVSNQVREEFEKIIFEMGGVPSSWYSVSRAMKELSTPTLWIHDEEDLITPFEDMQHMIDMKLPHIQFEITKGLGHSVYRDNKVNKQIIDFLGTLVNESEKAKV